MVGPITATAAVTYSFVHTLNHFFQSSEILILPSQYTLSLMTFLSQTLKIYTFNFTVHGINTRNKLQLHKPTACGDTQGRI